MKVSSDSLWRLIQSLTPSEKRYCSLTLSKYGTEVNNYTQLFDAMSRMRQFDEEQLKKNLSGTNIGKNLSTVKGQLKNQVLDCLVQFGKNSSERDTLLSGIQRARALGQKGFKGDAIGMLDKLIEQANNEYGWELMVLALQQKRSFISTGTVMENADLLERLQATLANINNEAEYYQLVRTLLGFRFSKEFARDESAINELNAIMSHPLLADIQMARTIGARYYFYTLFALYHSIQHQYQEASAYYRLSLDLMRDNPSYANQHKEEYFNRLNSYVSKLSGEGYTAAFQEALNELYALKSNPRFAQMLHFESLLFVYGFTHKAQAYFYSHNYVQGLAMVKEHRAEAPVHWPNVPPRAVISFCYCATVLSFGANDLQEALHWIVKAKERRLEGLENLQTVMRLMEVIAHFQLGNYDLLEYLLRNTIRFLKKEERYYQSEYTLLSAYQKLVKLPMDSVSKEFSKLGKQLTKLKENPTEAGLYQAFDFAEWHLKKLQARDETKAD